MTYEEFIEGVLPGNYFLTKSMEISKINSSGTLWYTKKFLVYYYYIFLSNNITTVSVTREIAALFDSYIRSLPEELRQDATDFFYSSSPLADIRHTSFRLFGDFAGTVRFDADSERIAYYEMAKKYYFAFLMESGGQSGVKRHIKTKLYEDDFCFSQIDSIVNEFYEQEQRILTQRKLIEIKNDYMAFIRNERQILYYYGFFHSKSSGSNDKEFSSLTPVGELALRSNYYELIAVWEHQKIKMISQPVTVDIQNISDMDVDGSKFGINHDPYLSILLWLSERGYISSDEYKYIISRLKTPVANNIEALTAHIGEIEEKILEFGRKGDTEDEDFAKEIKKYLLGIESDFSLDRGANPIGLCKRDSGGIYRVTNGVYIKNIISVYIKLSEYKRLKYEELFSSCETELRRQYTNKLSGESYTIEPKIKINWDIYNIHVDKVILLGTFIAMTECQINKRFHDETIREYADNITLHFEAALKTLGISRSALRDELKSLLYSFESSNYDVYLMPQHDDYDLSTTKYGRENAQDLDYKIRQESERNVIVVNGERKRNTKLIHLIKAYNNKVFVRDDKLHCECCGEFTFATDNGETFLEYHHLIPFSLFDGPDHFLNIYAVCPTCHRKIHFMRLADKGGMYRQLSANNYRQMPIEERLKELFGQRKLRSYQLEFLLADNAITDNQYSRILAS